VSDGSLVCREIAGEVELRGGLLWEDEQAIAFHVPPTDENWMSVDELPDAPHGDADQIAALVERLRVRL
jgi:hypothetical protein